MATIIRHIDIDAPAADVWDAVADFGAVDTRLAPGLVVDVRLEPGARIVTFADGMVLREIFLGLDVDGRRLAYSVRSAPFEHHNASFEVIEIEGSRCRLRWVADLLPDEIAPAISELMENGLEEARRTLGRGDLGRGD